jgi:hypothetical protein
MTTFNVDSLDFVSDESMQFGDASNFEMQFNSTSAQLEIADRVNSAVASIPTGRSGDLVDGRFSETIAEGKALADSGEVFGSIQDAVDAASSYVRVGPGTFRESVNIDTPGLSLVGSGERTLIDGGSTGGAIVTNATNVVIDSVKTTNTSDGIADGGGPGVFLSATGCVLQNSVADITNDLGVSIDSDSCVVHNCRINGSDGEGIYTFGGNDVIFSNNIVTNVGRSGLRVGKKNNVIMINNIIRNPGSFGIRVGGNDCIVIGNRIIDSSPNGISLDTQSDSIIVANNRITGSSGAAIDDDGNGTILDGNLTG